MSGKIVPNLQLVPLRQVMADNCHMSIVGGDMPPFRQRQGFSGEQFVILRAADAQRLCVSLIFCIG